MARISETQAKDRGNLSLTPVRPGLLQRKCGCGGSKGVTEQCDACTSNALSLQRSPMSSSQPSSVPPIIGEVLGSQGQPLDQSTRAFFEPRFGHHFSQVRVHAGARAAESARAINSLAFTLGDHIVFGERQFSPETNLGKQLLAHELTHVIQQGAAGGSRGSVAIGPADDGYEREADSVAERVLQGTGPTIPLVSSRTTPGTLTIRRKCPALSGGSTGCACTTATKPSQGTPPTKVPEFTVAGATRTQWRVGYNQRKETESPLALLKRLHISAEEPYQEGKLWTFCYCPLSQAEAASEAKHKQTELGENFSVIAKFSDQAKSYFVDAKAKCPQAIPKRTGFDIWSECFSEKQAKAFLEKFKRANVQAEVFQLDEDQFGLYFKPMSEQEAKSAGQKAASGRGGFKEGMFQVETAKSEELKTYTYGIKTSCPTGFTEKKQGFRLTTYVLAQEKEFSEDPSVKDPCGLKGKFRQKFLFQTGKVPPLGVKKEGSGESLSGKIIQYAPSGGKDCFQVVSCPKTKTGTCATAGRTVAVDKTVIPLKSTLLIEDVGLRVAEDTGGQVNGAHIDVYRGTELSAVEANKASLENKKVCVKK
jgi:3D (Asp-Asp-Asp) domain-containing protein